MFYCKMLTGIPWTLVYPIAKAICIQIAVVKLNSSNAPMNIVDGAEQTLIIVERISKL